MNDIEKYKKGRGYSHQQQPNWRNYKKLWDINLFDLCERKKKEFVRILNNLKVFCFLNEAELENIFESFEMSQSKIAKEWGVCHSIISAIKNNKRKITFPELFYLSKSTKILGKLEGIRIANSTCFENNSENKEFIEYIHKIKEAMFSYSSICQASTQRLHNLNHVKKMPVARP